MLGNESYSAFTSDQIECLFLWISRVQPRFYRCLEKKCYLKLFAISTSSNWSSSLCLNKTCGILWQFSPQLDLSAYTRKILFKRLNCTLSYKEISHKAHTTLVIDKVPSLPLIWSSVARAYRISFLIFPRDAYSYSSFSWLVTLVVLLKYFKSCKLKWILQM